MHHMYNSNSDSSTWAPPLLSYLYLSDVVSGVSFTSPQIAGVCLKTSDAQFCSSCHISLIWKLLMELVISFHSDTSLLVWVLYHPPVYSAPAAVWFCLPLKLNLKVSSVAAALLMIFTRELNYCSSVFKQQRELWPSENYLPAAILPQQ